MASQLDGAPSAAAASAEKLAMTVGEDICCSVVPAAAATGRATRAREATPPGGGDHDGVGEAASEKLALGEPEPLGETETLEAMGETEPLELSEKKRLGEALALIETDIALPLGE
jgi:hypothetical protein